ncbi:lipopolysaccharide-induced tumor necrosis factor-alpha factor homolog isoform X2 [Nelusetta ayraudi]
MEPSSKVDKPFPTPPLYFLPDEYLTGSEARVYHMNSQFSPPPPPPSFSFSPGIGCSTKNQLSFTGSALPPVTPRPKFVSYESRLVRSPALTTCPSCEAQVTTRVTYKVGVFAWLMCLVFVLCGLLLGCCLISFFVDHFKDAYHICPRCQRVLHIHRKTCC